MGMYILHKGYATLQAWVHDNKTTFKEWACCNLKNNAYNSYGIYIVLFYVYRLLYFCVGCGSIKSTYF